MDTQRASKTLLLCLAALSLCAMERSVAAAKSAEAVRYFNLEFRAFQLRPRPPIGPMRTQNISDVEVLEIQAAAANVMPKAIVNIGSVVTGCPCEDGPNCADQVWVVAFTPEQSAGMLFSRIDGTWGVGPVQKWQLDLQELERRRNTFQKYSDFLTAERALLDRFPVCAAAK